MSVLAAMITACPETVGSATKGKRCLNGSSTASLPPVRSRSRSRPPLRPHVVNGLRSLSASAVSPRTRCSSPWERSSRPWQSLLFHPTSRFPVRRSLGPLGGAASDRCAVTSEVTCCWVPPAAAVVPAVVAVVLAPPSSNGPFSRDALDQSAAVEYVRAVLFGSLFLTAISSAVAAVPQPGDFLAETFVGCFFLGLSSALAALLRPQGLLLALRRVEAEARAKSYAAAIERQLKACADAGVPAWMMKTSPWSGIFLRLAIVTKAGTPVGLWFLGVFLWEEMLAGGTTLGRAGSAGLIAIVLGSLAGASWPLAFQARGDWLSIEAGRARWAEFVSYLFLGTILLSLIGVLSAGIWLSDEVWWRRGIGLATGVTGVLGLVWPVARANSRLAVAVDYRCLLQRSQVASDQWALLGGVDEDRETYEWPFPRTRPVVE